MILMTLADTSRGYIHDLLNWLSVDVVLSVFIGTQQTIITNGNVQL